VWRSVVPEGGVPWRNYWCDQHLPHRKPLEQPAQLCVVCGGPMSLPDDHDTHSGCAPDTGNGHDTDTALTLLRDVLGAEPLTHQETA